MMTRTRRIRCFYQLIQAQNSSSKEVAGLCRIRIWWVGDRLSWRRRSGFCIEVILLCAVGRLLNNRLTFLQLHKTSKSSKHTSHQDLNHSPKENSQNRPSNARYPCLIQVNHHQASRCTPYSTATTTMVNSPVKTPRPRTIYWNHPIWTVWSQVTTGRQNPRRKNQCKTST